MKTRKNVLFSFCFSVLIVAACVTASIGVLAADFSEHAVSPAISMLAEDNSMAMAGIKGKNIEFECDDFARAMNLSSVDSITITEVPSVACGELRVGDRVVQSGQVLEKSDIEQLVYEPMSVASSASFRFRVDGFAHDVPCNLYLLTSANSAPTLNTAPSVAQSVSTHKNVILYGTLPCYDADGDATCIEIVSYPENGSLILVDKSYGEYTYLPDSDFTGKDSFTYVARDMYGNYSTSQTVSLSVAKPQVSVIYNDMLDSPEYNAALTMTELGLMSGMQIGSDTYFYPDKTVSRGEFTVLAMQAIGIKEVSPCSKTVFADDADIPSNMKDYIHAAYQLGYVNGLFKDGELYFECNRAITRSEAAVLLGNILDLATPTVAPSFSDSGEIPAWAASSVYSLTSAGIMSSDGGRISPLSSITRGDAAVILTNMVNLKD